MDLMLLIYISWAAVVLVSLLFVLYLIVTAPVSLPYFKIKLLGGTLLVIKRMNGAYVFRRSPSTDSVLDVKGFGSFVSNPEAATRVAGLPGFVVYEGHAVPPTIEAQEAGQILKDQNYPAHMDLRSTATEAGEDKVLTQIQVDSLYNYANAINPHYVNSRVERKIAEHLRQMRNPISTIFTYVIMLCIFMICAGIAYQMVMSGAASNAVESVATSINM